VSGDLMSSKYLNTDSTNTVSLLGLYKSTRNSLMYSSEQTTIPVCVSSRRWPMLFLGTFGVCLMNLAQSFPGLGRAGVQGTILTRPFCRLNKSSNCLATSLTHHKRWT